MSNSKITMAQNASNERHTISAIILNLQHDLNMIMLIKCSHSGIKRKVINLQFKTCKSGNVKATTEFAMGNKTTIHGNEKA